MQSKVIIQISVVVLATGVLSACDRASRDVGADMAACNLEEFKTNYPSKARLWRDLEVAADEGERQLQPVKLVNQRRQFLKWCMRVRGWELPNGHTTQIARCFLDNFDQANCYQPASPAGDGIVK